MIGSSVQRLSSGKHSQPALAPVHFKTTLDKLYNSAQKSYRKMEPMYVLQKDTFVSVYVNLASSPGHSQFKMGVVYE